MLENSSALGGLKQYKIIRGTAEEKRSKNLIQFIIIRKLPPLCLLLPVSRFNKTLAQVTCQIIQISLKPPTKISRKFHNFQNNVHYQIIQYEHTRIKRHISPYLYHIAVTLTKKLNIDTML